MDSVGAFEAKTHLAALLERVAKGETIQITRRGVPVAVLAPVGDHQNQGWRDAAAEIRRLRKGNKLCGLTIRQLINEGRKY